jgi:hypothetical protein
MTKSGVYRCHRPSSPRYSTWKQVQLGKDLPIEIQLGPRVEVIRIVVEPEARRVFLHHAMGGQEEILLIGFGVRMGHSRETLHDSPVATASLLT